MTETDRRLIEDAAWASGLPECGWMGPAFMYVKDNRLTDWNPLTDDGDAQWLAEKLKVQTGFDDRFASLGACAFATYRTGDISCNSIMQNIAEAGGKEAATRRAIVRAAAAIRDLT